MCLLNNMMNHVYSDQGQWENVYFIFQVHFNTLII